MIQQLFLQIAEAKNVEKIKPQTNLMKKIEADFSKNSIAEAKARIDTMTDKKDKEKQRLEQRYIISMAHYQLIIQDNPNIIDRSIRYLLKLNQKFISPKQPDSLGFEILEEYFDYRSFCQDNKVYKTSTSLLISEVLSIVTSYRNTSQGVNEEFDVKVDIIAEFLRRYRDLDQYLPKQNYVIRVTQIFNVLVNNKQLEKIKTRYLKQEKYIDFQGDTMNIRELIDTYFLLNMKRKICFAKIRSKLPYNEVMVQIIQNTKKKLMTNKQIAQKNVPKNDEIIEKMSFSQLYKQFEMKARSKYNHMSPEESVQMAQVFEDISKEQIEPTTVHPKIVNLLKKVNIRDAFTLVLKYKMYKKRKQDRQKLYGKDLSDYKRELITRIVRTNPSVTYEQVVLKLYNKKNVFIQREFFEENIVAILRKENQFQQFFYLHQVLKGIEEYQRLGTQIVFVDYCNFEREGEGQTEHSMIAAVTLGGTMSCNLYTTKMSIQVFLQEIVKMLDRPRKKSILVFYDRNFPYEKWLNRPQTVFLRDYYLFLNMPFIAAVPNPCQALCKSIWNFIKESNSKGQSKKISVMYEESVSFYREKDMIKYIICEQWKKSKCFLIKNNEEKYFCDEGAVVKISEEEKGFSREDSLQQKQQNIQRKLFKEENEPQYSQIIKMEYQQSFNQGNVGFVEEEHRNNNQTIQSLPLMENLTAQTYEQHRQFYHQLSLLLSGFHISKNFISKWIVFTKNFDL